MHHLEKWWEVFKSRVDSYRAIITSKPKKSRNRRHFKYESSPVDQPAMTDSLQNGVYKLKELETQIST